MPEPSSVLEVEDPVTLVELVNRVVDRGVALSGDITISVADIDLLYLGVRLLLCSPERVDAARPGKPPLALDAVAEPGRRRP